MSIWSVFCLFGGPWYDGCASWLAWTWIWPVYEEDGLFGKFGPQKSHCNGIKPCQGNSGHF